MNPLDVLWETAQTLDAVIQARKLLDSVTPLKTDCGRTCGGACCQPDEDG